MPIKAVFTDQNFGRCLHAPYSIATKPNSARPYGAVYRAATKSNTLYILMNMIPGQ